eukprot:3947264-Alexandrium_andersonii.AAC.1
MPARCASRRSTSIGGRPTSTRLRKSGSARACRTARGSMRGPGTAPADLTAVGLEASSVRDVSPLALEEALLEPRG